MPHMGSDQWLWKHNLDILRKGGSLGPGIGLEEEKEYIRRRILDCYGSFEGLRILGAGCGTGRTEALLSNEGADVVCLDHISEAIEISRIHAQRMHCTEHFIVGDIRRMPFKDKTFDLINSGGVLEHFENLEDILYEHFRITKPNGMMIASVPNLIGRNARLGIKPLRELVFRKSTKDGFIERNFSGRKFRRIIEQSGFICVEIAPTLFNIHWFFPFNYLRRGLILLGIYGLYSKTLYTFGGKFPGIAFGYSFIIVLARRPAF